MMYSHRGASPISRFATNRDPDSRFPAKSGNGGFPDSRFRPNWESGDSLPDSRPNRESGERELGISGSAPPCRPCQVVGSEPGPSGQPPAVDIQLARASGWPRPGGPGPARAPETRHLAKFPQSAAPALSPAFSPNWHRDRPREIPNVGRFQVGQSVD